MKSCNSIGHIISILVLAGTFYCICHAEEKKASNFEFSNNRGSLSGTLTSSCSWQLEAGYHYMLCRYVGVGGSIGLWKVYFEEGRAHGDDWEVDWDDDNNNPENFYLRPSLILKTPAIKIKSVDLGLYAEPGVMLNVPYAQVWVSQKIDRHRYESKRVWTNGGQWFAADLRAGVYVNVGPCGLSAGYMMSNHDVYSQFRSLSYRGVSFKRFYPRMPFMQGAYLTLSYYF